MMLNLVKAKFALFIKSAAVRVDALLVLYCLCLYIADCIRRLCLKSNDLAIEHLHENLHAKVEVQGRVILDLRAVVSECSIILELVAGQEEALVATNLFPGISDRV
jgi:hypothetical protein